MRLHCARLGRRSGLQLPCRSGCGVSAMRSGWNRGQTCPQRYGMRQRCWASPPSGQVCWARCSSSRITSGCNLLLPETSLFCPCRACISHPQYVSWECISAILSAPKFFLRARHWARDWRALALLERTCVLEHLECSQEPHIQRAGELRSAPSGPDDRYRVAGKRALAPGVAGARLARRVLPDTPWSPRCEHHV